MLIPVLAFLLTLGLLVIVHEYGHYKVARLCGVKVLRFSVGFGHVIWRRQSAPDEPEFTLSALPLGGYVRMLDSREADVAPALWPQAFDRQALWRRVAIVSAGPVANLLLAVLLYAGANWAGTVEPKALIASPPANSMAAQAGLVAGDLVEAVAGPDSDWQPVSSLPDLRWQITQAALESEPLQLQIASPHRRVVVLPLDQLGGSELDAAATQRIGVLGFYSEPVLGQILPGGAAAAADLREGDRVVWLDGHPVADAQALRAAIREAKGPMDWTVERHGQRLEITVTPQKVDDNGTQVGRIAAMVGQVPEMVTVRWGLWDGFSKGATQTWDMSSLSLRMMGRMLTGEASVKNLSGPLTIADVAGQSIQRGLSYYLGFLAMVSVSLGVLNLLPLPMLDGGHLMYYLFEGVTGRPVSDVWLKWLQRGGALVLLLLMSIALSNDVARLAGLQ
jgi:regulator of sigma E protease